MLLFVSAVFWIVVYFMLTGKRNLTICVFVIAEMKIKSTLVWQNTSTTQTNKRPATTKTISMVNWPGKSQMRQQQTI